MDGVCLRLAVIVGFLSFSRISAASEAPKPHIVFILADDLGWHDVGYHDSIIRTPNIDKLAANGVKLENYYVTPLCTPTRAVLMTGRYQIHTGMQHGVLMAQEPRCLPTDEVIMPQKLKENGYSTHMVGKWHLGFYKWGCTPSHRGFDSFFGMYLAGGDYFNHTRMCHGHRYAAWDLRDNDAVVAPKYVGQYSTILFAEKAQEVIRKQDPNVPMFLYLSFQAVHSPLQVPESYSDAYKHDIRDESRRIYAGMTSCMDEAIGNVTETLRETGLLNNTIIVFSSDNGGAKIYGASNYPLRGQKGTLYEGGVRAPAFVYSPLLNNRYRGTVNGELMYVGDWLPTFLHLAGGNVRGMKPLDGVNQWKTISAGMPSERMEIVHNIEPLRGRPPGFSNEPWLDNPYFDIRVMASIRAGNWKLITGRKGDPTWTIPPELGGGFVDPGRSTIVELYNIKDDPLEKSDVAKERPDIVVRLLRRLQYHRASARLPETPKPVFDSSDPLHHNLAWAPWVE